MRGEQAALPGETGGTLGRRSLLQGTARKVVSSGTGVAAVQATNAERAYN